MEVSTNFSTFAAKCYYIMGSKETLGVYIDIHRPHPGSIMKEWMIKTIYQHLKEYGHIK